MKIHLLLPLFLLPWAAQGASVYIEPRVSVLSISGTPSVGDLGREIRSDVPNLTASLAAGVMIAPIFAVELRYSAINRIAVRKQATSTQIFPRDGVFAPVLTEYDFAQSSRLLSLAVPVRLLADEKFSVSLTPLLVLERSEITLTPIPSPFQTTVPGSQPNVSVIPGPLPPIYHKTESKIQAAAEISAAYVLTKRLSATLSYTYSPLKTFDAHLLNAGLRIAF